MIEVSSPEQFLHNSDLKLRCLAAAYYPGCPFHYGMLNLDDGMAEEVAQLPEIYWSQLPVLEFVRITQLIDIAEVLNRMHHSKTVVVQLLLKSFRQEKRIVSLAFNVEKISKPVYFRLKDALFRVFNPFALILSYGPNLSKMLAEVDGIPEAAQPVHIWEGCFGFQGESWDALKDLIMKMLTKAQKGSMSLYDKWGMFDELYQYDQGTSHVMERILLAIIDKIDWREISRQELVKFLALYGKPDGLAVRLELYLKPNSLQNYVENELDLSDVTLHRLISPTLYNGIGETAILLGYLDPADFSFMTKIPFSLALSYREDFPEGHLSPRWVEGILLPSPLMQSSLFFAMVWNPNFPVTRELTGDLLKYLDRFDSTYGPLLTILKYISDSGDYGLDIGGQDWGKKRLEMRILRKIMGINVRQHTKEQQVHASLEEDLSEFIRDGGRSIKKHPMWQALHERIDLLSLSPSCWRLIFQAVHTHQLKSILAARYLLGCIDAEMMEIANVDVPSLPYPEWSKELHNRLVLLEPYLEQSPTLQEALLLAVKWDENLALPESMVDLILTRFDRITRKDICLVAIDWLLDHSKTYTFPAVPKSMQTILQIVINIL